MTTTLITDVPMAELVRRRPSLTGVFERLGLDYCCHGERTLAQAAAAAGVDLAGTAETVEGALAGAEAPAAADGDAWMRLGPGALADHIEAVHHARLRTELPALEELAGVVYAAHGDRHPELSMVGRLVGELRDDILPHLDKEERVLFPAIRARYAEPGQMAPGDLAAPVAVMTAEHERTGGILVRLRAATDSYRPPSDGCAKVTALYRGLQQLEADTHLHVFKENSFLFPAATAVPAACEVPPATAMAAAHRADHP